MKNRYQTVKAPALGSCPYFSRLNGLFGAYRCQTLSGPLPQSGSPAREARGAAAAATSGKLTAPTSRGEVGQCMEKSCRAARLTTRLRFQLLITLPRHYSDQSPSRAQRAYAPG